MTHLPRHRPGKGAEAGQAFPDHRSVDGRSQRMRGLRRAVLGQRGGQLWLRRRALSMSMMSSRGLPSACETAATGAVSLLALLKASGVAPVYQDWDNNYWPGDTDRCVNVHCSNHPAAAFREKPGNRRSGHSGHHPGRRILLRRAEGPGSGRIMTTFWKSLSADRPTTGRHRVLVWVRGNSPTIAWRALAAQRGGVPCENSGRTMMHYVANDGFERHVAIVAGGMRRYSGGGAGQLSGLGGLPAQLMQMKLRRMQGFRVRRVFFDPGGGNPLYRVDACVIIGAENLRKETQNMPQRPNILYLMCDQFRFDLHRGPGKPLCGHAESGSAGAPGNQL